MLSWHVAYARRFLIWNRSLFFFLFRKHLNLFAESRCENSRCITGCEMAEAYNDLMLRIRNGRCKAIPSADPSMQMEQKPKPKTQARHSPCLLRKIRAVRFLTTCSCSDVSLMHLFVYFISSDERLERTIQRRKHGPFETAATRARKVWEWDVFSRYP